jgi:cytosine/uracil/thiamine/allantoin permease
MNVGRLSSAALMLSGISGVVMPTRVASALDLSALSSRGVAETRAGLGGTYAALGGWALLSRDPTAQAAVGVTWLGAAAVRLGSLLLDRPRTDGAF